MAGPAQQTTQGFLSEVTNILAGGAADPGLAVYYLDALFGNWVSGSGTTYTLLTSSFVVINFLAFGLGVIIFLAAAIGGVMKTALQGEIMGKEWGSDTLPIKMFVGVACMMPIFVDANVSVSQRFGMNMLLAGSAAGDYTWRKILDDASMVVPEAKYSPALETASKSVFKSAICALAIAKQNGLERTPIAEVVYVKGMLSRQAFPSSGYRNLNKVTRAVYAASSGSSINPSATESRITSLLNNSSTREKINTIRFGEGGGCGSYNTSAGVEPPVDLKIDNTFSERIESVKLKLFRTGYPSLVTMIGSNFEEASKAINNGYSYYADARNGDNPQMGVVEAQANRINEISEKYITAVASDLSRESNRRQSVNGGQTWQESLVDPAKEAGWLYAGAWIMQLGRIIRVLPEGIDSLSDMSTSKPAEVCKNVWYKFWDTNNEDCDATKDIQLIPDVLFEFGAGSDESGIASTYRKIEECTDSSCSTNELESSISSAIAEYILYAIYGLGHLNTGPTASQGNGDFIIGTSTRDMTSHGIDTNPTSPFTDASGRQNPFAVLATLGHGMLNIGHIIEVAMLAPLKATADVAGETSKKFSIVGWGGFFLTNLLNYLAMKLLALSVLFTVLGAMLAYILPLLATIRWLGPALGFLVVAIEFHLVAPLAMMLLLIPEGSGILGTQLMTIIRYLAAVILRPTLCVLGLLGGYIGAYVVFGLYNGIFWTGMGLSTNMSLFEVVLAIYLYAYLAWQIIDKLMALPINLTRDILRWISPGHEPFGDAAFSEISIDPQQMGSMIQPDFAGISKMKEDKAKKNA